MNYDFNDIFLLAARLVNESSRNIFLTGKAGTGKTTFLKYIRENCSKQMVVVAPTGVAAINAGGVTMHSFFHLPFSPFIPATGGFNKPEADVTNKSNLLSRLRMTNEKKKILQQLELLIIDEVSMVRCDMLDAVDTVLRHVRRKHYDSFGGVQVLFIGDMFQLPPVIKDQEWQVLKEFYSGPYFFDSHVLKDDPPIHIEFEKIYRQQDDRFIHLLNQVRNNEIDDGAAKLLDSRFHKDFKRAKEDGYIILTTHNEKARIKNESELNKLDAERFSYMAEIDGEFAESSYPAEQELRLKIGAQVMFIKNDTDKIRRYFNGKIGIVQELSDTRILVQCKDDPEPIEVGKEKWENIRYSVDKSSRQIKEEVLGSFTQYPLRLAWAITIHKSQGLTFENVIIDAGEAFAPGQSYVALSRCTTLDGIILQSRIRSNGTLVDEKIMRFSKKNISQQLLEEELRLSRINYERKILFSLFDYLHLITELNEAHTYITENRSSFNDGGIKWLDQLTSDTRNLHVVGEKFKNQLEKLVVKEDLASVVLVKERISAAIEYFLSAQNKLIDHLYGCPVQTDRRIHAKQINEYLKEIFTALCVRKHLFDGLKEGFRLETYHNRKKSFVMPPFPVNVYAGAGERRDEVPNPQLYQQLRKLRDSICAKADLPIYIVAGTNTLVEMAKYLPQDLGELRRISGFGDAKIQKYGQRFLDLILNYCKENRLSSLIHLKSPKRERKTGNEKTKRTDTKAESFRLYKEGKNIDMIASERGLATQTIEGHLAHYVERGEIGIDELVSEDKILLIEPAAKKDSTDSITAIKQQLGDGITYGEIRLVTAWLKFQDGQRPI